MLITGIETQKKDSTRVSIYIDGEYAFGMPAADALYYKLTEGNELTEERYGVIIDEIARTKARDAALRFLGYRERSEKEITLYLREKEFGEAVIESAMELLKKYNYIDDRRFALLFIRDSIRLKKWAKKKIQFELKQKGIKEDIISELFDEVEMPGEDAALALLQKKLRGETHPGEKEKRNAYSFLIRKGFSHEDISAAFKMLADL